MRSIGIILIGGMLAFGAAASFYGEDIVGLNMGSASPQGSGANKKFADFYRNDGSKFHGNVQAAMRTCLKTADPDGLMPQSLRDMMASTYRYAALAASAKDKAEEARWDREMEKLKEKGRNIRISQAKLDVLRPLATDADLRNCVTRTAVSNYEKKPS